jgi:hypothetical protein
VGVFSRFAAQLLALHGHVPTRGQLTEERDDYARSQDNQEEREPVLRRPGDGDLDRASSDGVLLYGGGMKVWMVLALLAMGLGRSEEPPEQWSHPMRQSLVDGCVDSMTDPVTVEMLEKMGHTVLGICRDLLQKTEAEYTESDFLLLTDDERAEVVGKIGYDYGQEIGND